MPALGRDIPAHEIAARSFAEQLRLPLPAGTKERMRAALREGESMTGMIREAVERELVRRERRA